MENKRVILIISRAVVYVGLFAALCFLFWQQAAGAYPSDLPAHIKPPADNTYSALRIVYLALTNSFGVAGICAFLAAVEIATLALTEYLIVKLAPNVKPAAAFVTAVACFFTIAIYLPFIHSYYTVGSPGGNCWHNSTYLVMRLCALGAIAFYLKFDGRIPTRSKAGAWCGFALMLTLATSVKPSFAIVFGPAVFVLCLVDLKREGASSVKRSLLIGLALVVALLVVFYQLTVIFPSDGSEEGGIAFGLAKVWRARHANIFVSFFQSLAFPLLVAFITRFKCFSDRMFLLSWLTTFFAFAEYVFIYETGARTYHGNFGWGVSMAIYLLFVVAAAVYLQDRGHLFGLSRPTPDGAEERTPAPLGSPAQAAPASHPESAPAQPPATVQRNALDYIVLVAFALHTASGIWYFIRLMMGASFY